MQTDLVAIEDDQCPRHAWLYGDVLVTVWDDEARWYAGRPWRQCGRMKLGTSAADAIAGPEGAVLCWFAQGRISVSSWSSSDGGFGAPVHVDGEGLGPYVCQAFAPDGSHLIASGDGAEGVLVRRPPGAASYQRCSIAVPGKPARIYVHGDRIFVGTARECVTRGGVVLAAHADTYSGPDDEIDTTVSVGASHDFGHTWLEPVRISKRTDSDLVIHALASDGALVSYGGHGVEPWGQTIAYSLDGASWQPLRQGRPVAAAKALGPIHSVIETAERLFVFAHAEYACWRAGEPERLFDAPTPRGFSWPWVASAQRVGRSIMLVHLTRGNASKNEKGAIAISELAVPDA